MYIDFFNIHGVTLVMKYLKCFNLVFLSVLSFSSFAVEKEPVSTRHSFPYVGASAGYGVVQRDAASAGDFLVQIGNMAGSEFPTELINSILPIERKSGGLSGRLYTGYIFDIAKSLSIGPEIGFTYYHKNQTSQQFNFNIPQDAEGSGSISLNSDGFIKGMGTDLLLNATYFPAEQIMLYVKPGVQLAREENAVTGNLSVNLIEPNQPPTNISLLINNRFVTNRTVPEIIVGGNLRLPVTAPIFLGVSYQYVWKDATARREFISLNLEYIL